MIFTRVCRGGKTFFSDLDTCPDNSREIPVIPVLHSKYQPLWQCQDSMLSQKVEFEVIWRKLYNIFIKFVVVVILPGSPFLYLFSFIGKLHVFAMV